MHRFVCLLVVSLAAFAQTDPREIVRRSVQVDDRNFTVARDYTYVVHDVLRELDGKGKPKVAHDETREVLYVGGKPFRRLIQKAGKPLSAADEKNEQARLDKAIAEAVKLTPEQRERQARDWQNRRAKEREGVKDIPDAFDFKLLREEAVGGRQAYVIQAEPRAGYRGQHRELLSKMHGTLWIDKSDFHWIKAGAESLDTVSFGLFIARIAKGSHLQFEQTLVNGEIWLPKAFAVKASARVAVLKKYNIEQESTFSGYRKFSTDSKIVSTSAVP